MLMNHKDTSHMKNYNRSNFYDVHVCFFVTHFPPHLTSYVSYTQSYLFLHCFLPKGIGVRGLHTYVTTSCCVFFLHFLPITLFPHINISLKTIVLEQINNQVMSRTWNQMIKWSFESYWENGHEYLKSWWVWRESPSGCALVRNSHSQTGNNTLDIIHNLHKAQTLGEWGDSGGDKE